jgi:hypothetical protein
MSATAILPALHFDPDAVPGVLKGVCRWVVWCDEVQNGRWTKIPYDPRTGRRASVNNPRTWRSFAEAQAAAPQYDGIGFVLCSEDSFVGIDLDDCRDPDTHLIADGARAIIDEIGSYTEVSPSGTGIHIFSKGRLPPGGRKRGGVEMYDQKHFFTVTGSHLPGTPTSIEDRTLAIAALHGRIFGSAPSSPIPDSVPPRWLQMVDRWEPARRVWNGQGDHADKSPSGCDMFLGHFARRLGFNRAEVEQILRAAPYPVGGGRTADYLKRTVDRAFSFVGTRPRPQGGYGQLPNWIIATGTYAKLSRRAKAALALLVKHAERPSFIVRISMKRLASEANISIDRVGLATGELAAAGTIRKTRAMGGRWNIWIAHEPPPTYSAEGAEYVSEIQARPGGETWRSPTRLRRSAEYVRASDSALTAEHVVSDSWLRRGPGSSEAGPDPPVSPERGEQDRKPAGVATARALPSMRLDHELDGEGGKRVYRVCSDGRRVLVWQGTISEWASWTPPECLRFKARMAEWPRPATEDRPVAPHQLSPHQEEAESMLFTPTASAPVSLRVDMSRRCQATTLAGLACVGRPMVGSPFCKRHQNRGRPACAPVA